jgi:Zn-dependent peptidase ImmA (M78 family)/DNA-binding XRE family transcriptional regulator
MKPGTPGFIGARLREAREARGLTAISLAELLGVSRQAVSQYENDLQTPHPEVMRKIEQTLNLPVQFFWRPVAEPRKRKIFYRSMSAATKAARERAERRYEWLEEIVSFIREYLELPKVNFPVFDVPENPNLISHEMIEDLAIQARRFWKMGDGTISNVVWLAENNGAIVTRTALGADTLDAFSEWNEAVDTPYIILGAEKNVAARSRFDIAHEIGHLVLHRRIDRNRISKTSDFRLIENQAHRFAGAFLLPATAFSNDFSAPTLDALQALKSKWNVSIQMMLHRAQDLHLISTEQAQRLWINRTRRGWRLVEPLDDVLPVEQPRLLQRSFELLINEQVVTRSEIVSELPYAVMDIEELSGLPVGFLEEKPPPISIKGFTSGRVAEERPQNSRPGELVEFRIPKDSKRA